MRNKAQKYMKNKKIYFIIIWVLAVSLMVLIFIRVMMFIGDRTSETLSQRSNEQENMIEEKGPSDQGDNGRGSVDLEEEIVINYDELNDSEIYNLAKEDGDPTKCQKMKSEGLVDTCIALLAKDSGNTSACSMIGNSDKRVECADMAYFSKAISDNAGSECGNISDSDLAKACVVNMIDENSYKEKDCSLFPASIRDYCDEYQVYLDDIALFKSAQSRSECEKINNEAARVHCLDKFSL